MRLFAAIILLVLIDSCQTAEKEPILLADREAPLGWVYLRIFEDHSFEFESRGLERRGTIYDGSVELSKDTLIFNYKSEIPYAGTKAVIKNGGVIYLNGTSHEGLKIRYNYLE